MLRYNKKNPNVLSWLGKMLFLDKCMSYIKKKTQTVMNHINWTTRYIDIFCMQKGEDEID